MNRDEEIRLDVIKELELEPKISDPNMIKITVKNNLRLGFEVQNDI